MTVLNHPKTSTEVFQNYISGQWTNASQAATFDDENPARKGSVLGRFQSSSPGDITSAVDAAAEGFRRWRRTPVEERQQLGARFIHLLREKQEELAVIVSQENGKTLREARAEVHSALVEGTHHVYQVSRFCGQTLPAGTIGQTGWVQYHPLGASRSSAPGIFP